MSRFVIGEFTRAIDERHRLSIPGELMEALLAPEDQEFILAKERPGALSLWHAEDWGKKLDRDIELIRSKIEAGHLRDRAADVQLLGRLLSTRHRRVQIGGRGRLSIPEGFRGFLGVEPGGETVVIGAAICIEIWNPDSWIAFLNDQIPQFSQLVDELAS